MKTCNSRRAAERRGITEHVVTPRVIRSRGVKPGRYRADAVARCLPKTINPKATAMDPRPNSQISGSALAVFGSSLAFSRADRPVWLRPVVPAANNDVFAPFAKGVVRIAAVTGT